MSTSIEIKEADHRNPPTHAVRVRLVSSAQSWMESEAVRQLYAAAKLEGMREVVGFPDLHPGKFGPVGAAFISEDALHPCLIGNDIGCGMSLFETDLVRRKVKLDRWVDRLHGLESPGEFDVREWLRAEGLTASEFDPALGTIGGGNHFAELQSVEEVVDRGAFEFMGFDRESLFLLVHSGSRGFGESILREYTASRATQPLAADSLEGEVYLARHDEAVRWARLNRALIAHRFTEMLGAVPSLAWDGCHNSITRREVDGRVLWLHRKGASPVDSGFALIPGSRGTFSYLVKITGRPAEFAWSVAHGAGRKWPRGESRSRIRERYHPSELAQTGLGGRVICENRDLLYEEAPDAYKKIEVIIQDLVGAGLVSVIATLKPMITYKTRTIRR
jgi:release factor H-coupled RctB family protein